MISALVCAAFLLISGYLNAQAVINEVCYDPEGADSGKEWIELYNPGNQTIDLSGSKIYSCGTSWTLQFEFPYFLLRPGYLVMIGGPGMNNAQFYANLSFQNGGSASDAIRFVNADSTYTDTVIYDTPNSNLITDDFATVAYSFAEDAPEGCSLARVADGWDTNMCGDDFRVEQNPTPNLPNRVYTDLALYGPHLDNESSPRLFSVGIRNLGPYSTPYRALFNAYHNQQAFHQEELPPLALGDSLRISFILPDDLEMMYLQLMHQNDLEEDNNILHYSILGQSSGQLYLNEIFPAPLPGKQEWIELYAPPSFSRASYQIHDASGGSISFTLPDIPGYFVLCSDPESFLEEYPQCPSALVLQAQSWTPLNNTGDSLYLWDEYALLDSMSFASGTVGMSFQRLEEEGEVSWHVALPSPCAQNFQATPDLPEHDERLKIYGSPFDVRKAEFVSISYNLPAVSNRVNCSIWDLNGRKVASLAENLQIADRGVLYWDGKKSGGTYVARGLYLLLWESQSDAGSKVYRRQKSIVIK
ncbi:MAG: lamin tail domain-containing protein [Candidatus Cloacimonadales bacterium]|nr:lamin tail domain-containing protein [Candidatus Cloacimonadota bacterium]MDY0381291.1 lamin tail domain-containing protein [Candidatus Cloacimonadaceae bacterium]MCB5257116.1 lamin tail domain-containing protein [Candidatus Cloacimonadota bacterium]MCB5264369.1 lamin tail domain-containing protein [Candidatus Cloacimonadota bacterium]MCB5276608.1 lamin tail domain-containing protein [Candidatus Cloacimonadota bacterium]